MFQNFSVFLTNSLRYLNIANRSISLVRDVTPQLSKVKTTIKSMSSNIENVKSNIKRTLPLENSSNQKQQDNNNLPTFFQ